MKNRAKCKICNSIIESFHSTDYVLCKCAEISVSGGDAMLCSANDWKNFVRIDDNGNEIVPQVIDSNNETKASPSGKPNKKELLNMLKLMQQNIENLPTQALLTPVNHYDFLSLLMLLSSIFESED